MSSVTSEPYSLFMPNGANSIGLCSAVRPSSSSFRQKVTIPILTKSDNFVQYGEQLEDSSHRRNSASFVNEAQKSKNFPLDLSINNDGNGSNNTNNNKTDSQQRPSPLLPTSFVPVASLKLERQPLSINNNNQKKSSRSASLIANNLKNNGDSFDNNNSIISPSASMMLNGTLQRKPVAHPHGPESNGGAVENAAFSTSRSVSPASRRPNSASVVVALQNSSIVLPIVEKKKLALSSTTGQNEPARIPSPPSSNSAAAASIREGMTLDSRRKSSLQNNNNNNNNPYSNQKKLVVVPYWAKAMNNKNNNSVENPVYSSSSSAQRPGSAAARNFIVKRPMSSKLKVNAIVVCEDAGRNQVVANQTGEEENLEEL